MSTLHAMAAHEAIEALLHSVIAKTAAEFRSHASGDLTPSISACMTDAERTMARHVPKLARELADLVKDATERN